jgi:hypothetical protein
MIKKEELLARLQTDRQTLLATVEGVPDEALRLPHAVGTWSALDVLAHITAWDGETLRRIAFATGESTRSSHDVDDQAYWLAWNEQQVEMKRVMGPRGIKVDMASTWTRLLVRIESLPPLDYARWLEIDPYFVKERHDLEHARQLRAWRKQWEQALPWWQRLQHKLMKIKKKLSPPP